MAADPHAVAVGSETGQGVDGTTIAVQGGAERLDLPRRAVVRGAAQQAQLGEQIRVCGLQVGCVRQDVAGARVAQGEQDIAGRAAGLQGGQLRLFGVGECVGVSVTLVLDFDLRGSHGSTGAKLLPAGV
ncbi:hypothetical protein D3C78_1211430 [compost metagenome]